MVYTKEELTVSPLLLLKLGWRVGENGSLLQTQLAGRAHWLESQWEEAVCLG